MTQWFVVTTVPQGEIKAAAELQSAGLATMAPTYKRASRHARRLIERTEPHLRRYVCVAADTETVIWRESTKAKHVARPLTHASGAIARVRAHEVDRLAVLDGVSPDKDSGPRLIVGHVVRITDGPFIGFTGPIVYLSSEVAQVELQMFGAARRVPIAVESLEREQVAA